MLLFTIFKKRYQQGPSCPASAASAWASPYKIKLVGVLVLALGVGLVAASPQAFGSAELLQKELSPGDTSLLDDTLPPQPPGGMPLIITSAQRNQDGELADSRRGLVAINATPQAGDEQPTPLVLPVPEIRIDINDQQEPHEIEPQSIDPERLLQDLRIALDDTDYAEMEQATYACLSARNCRNLAPVLVAAGLSTAGTILAGIDPNPVNVIAGSLLMGVGNGLSTYVAWQRKHAYKAVEKVTALLSKLIVTVAGLEVALTELAGALDLREALSEAGLDNIVGDRDEASKNAEAKGCWRSYYGRNAGKLALAAGLSGAAGWIPALSQSIPAIATCGGLSGLGNAISTYLILEKATSAELKKRFTHDLPQLASQVQADVEAFIRLMTALNKSHPQVVKSLRQTLAARPAQPSTSFPTTTSGCPRQLRNAFCVAAAGGLSLAGGLCGGFYPTHLAAILVGGSLGAAGNAASTILAWEHEHEQAIEEVLIKDFPVFALKAHVNTARLSELSSRLAVPPAAE